MTRAVETLTLITHRDHPVPYENDLQRQDGQATALGLIRLQSGVASGPAPTHDRIPRTYQVLSLKDVYISYAGTHPPQHQIHTALSKLRTGDKLRLRIPPNGRVQINAANQTVGKLSNAASAALRDSGAQVEEARILGLVQWISDECKPQFRRPAPDRHMGSANPRNQETSHGLNPTSLIEVPYSQSTTLRLAAFLPCRWPEACDCPPTDNGRTSGAESPRELHRARARDSPFGLGYVR